MRGILLQIKDIEDVHMYYNDTVQVFTKKGDPIRFEGLDGIVFRFLNENNTSLQLYTHIIAGKLHGSYVTQNDTLIRLISCKDAHDLLKQMLTHPKLRLKLLFEDSMVAAERSLFQDWEEFDHGHV